MKKVSVVILLWMLWSQGFTQHFINAIDSSKSKDFREIVENVERYYKDRDKGKGSGYKQFKRWEYWNSTRLDPNGKVINFIEREIEEDKVYRKKQSTARSASTPQANWQSRGPLTHTFLSSGYSDGLGRVNCIVVDPANPSIIYAGTPAGGLWRSTNGGTSWAPLTDSYSATVGISGIVIDPTSPTNNRKIYILTGDGDGATTLSLGVLVSNDNGTTWNNTGLTWTWENYVRGYRLVQHPSNANMLFAVTTAGIYKTTNGGTSWTRTSINNHFVDMEFKPGMPSVCYASSTYGEVYRSTNTGDSWSQVTSGLTGISGSRVAIGVTPANPNYVYLLVADRGVFRSTDSGLSYINRNSYNFTASQGWYDIAIAISPTDAEEVHVGGLDCWRSYNGGQGFIQTSSWIRGNPGYYTHADIHALEYIGTTLYCGSDGGVYKTTNKAASWESLSDGLSITEFYRIAVDPHDATRVLGGAQDNGSNILFNKNLYQWFGADGMECIVDHTNPSTIYGAYQSGGLFKSINNGENVHSFISPDWGGYWVTPFIMDPQNSQTLYAGYSDIWKTTNGGTSWTNISTGRIPQGVSHLAISPSHANTLYGATWNSIYRTTNGGTTWSAQTVFSNSVTRIYVHPTNPDIVYVTMGGFVAEEKVLKSTNGGATFTNISGSLPNIVVNTIIYQLGTNEGLYIGTDRGVYYKDATMADWVPYNAGLPSTIVTDLEIHYGARKLVAGTYGRGIWESNLYTDQSGPVVSISAAGTPREGGPKGSFTITGVNLTSNVVVNYTRTGTASTADFTSSPTLSGSVTLTPAQPSVTYTITAVDDNITEGNETLILTLAAGTGFTLGNASAQMIIEDNELPPPVITSSLSASGAVNTYFTYTITATNNPTSFGATGLPAGLTLNTSSGLIYGTPATAGTYNVTITATNSGGTGQAVLVINVNSINIVLGGIYKITARHSGKALDIAGINQTNGALAQQWTWSNGSNQRWKIENAGDGYYKLIAQHSNKVLDVKDVSTSDNANVHQWDWVNADNQKWKFIPVGDGFYKIEAKHSGKVLDVFAGSTSNGAQIKQFAYGGGWNQQWSLELLPNTLPADRLLDFDNADVDLAVNANANSEEETISFYPNPADKAIQLKLYSFKEDADIIIVDIEGREMFKAKAGNEKIKKIDTSKLTNGYYTLIVRDSKQSKNMKLIVAH